jgi:O-antigen biosynthesis protein
MSRELIITGMHRSGTSLVSSLIQQAGIHIGEKLITANSANPRGYFEDIDFYEFHEDALHQRGQTYLHVDGNFTFQSTAHEAERAVRLVADRSWHPVWGWKDPRTSLFLPFWDELLPEARFLFVFRHPIEVLLSLLRRGEFDSHPTLLTALEAWHTYNANIETFFDNHPDRCLLVHINGVVSQGEKFIQLLREKLQFDSCLDSSALAQTYHANELQKTAFSSELTATLTKLHPQLLALYQRLNQKADLHENEVQTDSAVPADLRQLAQFTVSLAEPMQRAVKHSLVQLLLRSLAPEPTERMLERFDHSAKETQQKIDWLWMEVQRLQRLSAEQSVEINTLSGCNANQNSELDGLRTALTETRQELELLQQVNLQQATTLDSLQWLNLEQGQELERQTAKIESLAAELNSICGTPVGKALRSYRNLRERWRKVA